jgi:two-component system nitrogen regulation sensor histidine kinase GlnL
VNAHSAGPDPAAQIGGLIFAMLLIDPTGKIVEANQAAENMLGKSTKRLLGKPFLDIVQVNSDRVRSKLSEPDAALVARDVTLQSANGHKHINLTISPTSGFPGWRVLTMSDAGRDDTSQQSEDEGMTLGAPSILAHEIKNPLAAIRGAAQLTGRKLQPQDRSLAVMITSEVDRIARLIDRMQQLGSNTPEPVGPCNLHEVIRAAIATVRAASEQHVTIKEEFDPSLPPVLASRDALEQVLINLVSNARDAAVSSNDQPEITVKTRFVSGLVFSAIRLGRSVKLPIEITVSDNGAGIDKRVRDHVFEPFVTSKKSGQGLGLALVRKLVRDMNGRIGHDRDESNGLTHFRINLAVAPESENR